VAFGIWSSERLAGSLAYFGCHEAAVDLPNNEAFNRLLAKSIKARNIRSWRVSGDFSEDHSSIVPLWYLCQAGWTGPITVVSLNYPGGGGLEELGLAIADAAKEYAQPVAFIASGDMSHRLLRNAPAGYHPQAQIFDSEFVELLNKGDYTRMKNFDADLRNLAAEDVVDSTLVAMAATGYCNRGSEVLSYEGPFGVGYTVAVLYDSDGKKTEKTCSLDMLLDYAKSVVAAAVKGREAPQSPPAIGELARKAGVFVTIYKPDGNLRGCMGTIGPTEPNVVRQTEYCAKLAACEDPRFHPVRADELEGLKFEVSVLYEPEPIESKEYLDPQTYGVIISATDGRRALMLPGIEQLDTIDKQLSATRQKAGIGPSEPISLMRFKVDKIK
jgi:AmmeMemoRadiSam system protein A